jgi:hypothetical protein
MAEAALRRATAHFDEQRVIDLTLRVYEDLLGSGAARTGG